MKKPFTNPDTLTKRFLAKVNKLSENGCWIWTGSKTKQGVGMIGYGHTNIGANRASWLIHFGPIPDNVNVIRTEECQDPSCVAPHHLMTRVGSNYSAAKLTPEDVVQIRDSDETLQVLAERYGVTDSAISLVKLGRTWKQISSTPFTNPDTLEKRFWAKVQKRSDTDCWIWIGGKGGHGYGVIGCGYGQLRAHRASWEIHFGPIPEKMDVLHECDNPACVAPHHLFLGNHLKNMQDKEAKGRGNQPIGARNKASKLTVEMVREIKQSNETQQALADRYGVTDGAINHILMGRTWKHVI